MSYFLAPKVHSCLLNGQIVFLDLARDRYLSLDPARTRLLVSVADVPVDATGDSSDDSISTVPGASAHALAGLLVRRGLLVAREEADTATTVSPISAAGDLLPNGFRSIERLAPVKRLKALSALRRASRLLWRKSICEIVERVERRKAQQGPHDRPLYPEEARQLVALFLTLRPFYRRERRCLFESLALIEFLASYRLYPTWVFGVRVDPFHAHCWLQEKELVLNDSVETVHHYTPIMAV